MAKRMPLPLRTYRLLSALLVPLTPLYLAWRARRGREHRSRLRERRGESKLARPAGALVWVHGASVGELASVIPLIERIHAQRIAVLVTTGTVTSARLAEQRLPRGVVHQFVPLDVPRFVYRFLDHWRPNLALFVESDLWPITIFETYRRGIPLILVNGRLSQASFRRWRRLAGTIATMLNCFDLCLARTPADAERYGNLGAPRIVTTGDLKLDVPAPPAQSDRLQALQTTIGARPVIAAASTHPGEEAMVIAAHRRLRANHPRLLTILVPRHPHRGPEIAEMAGTAGLPARLRSRGQFPDQSTEIYVADTVGELGLIYRLAPIVFMGGSLVPHGGQNPIEAAKLGAAVVHGPHVRNFSELYEALDSARGAELVNDSGHLTACIAAWLGRPEQRAQVADAGRATVEALGGALERTVLALEPYFLQLRIEQQAEDA